MSAAYLLNSQKPETQSQPAPQPVVVKKPTVIQTFNEDAMGSVKLGLTFATALAWQESMNQVAQMLFAKTTKDSWFGPISSKVAYAMFVTVLSFILLTFVFPALMKGKERVINRVM